MKNLCTYTWTIKEFAFSNHCNELLKSPDTELEKLLGFEFGIQLLPARKRGFTRTIRLVRQGPAYDTYNYHKLEIQIDIIGKHETSTVAKKTLQTFRIREDTDLGFIDLVSLYRRKAEFLEDDALIIVLRMSHPKLRESVHSAGITAVSPTTSSFFWNTSCVSSCCLQEGESQVASTVRVEPFVISFQGCGKLKIEIKRVKEKDSCLFVGLVLTLLNGKGNTSATYEDYKFYWWKENSWSVPHSLTLKTSVLQKEDSTHEIGNICLRLDLRTAANSVADIPNQKIIYHSSVSPVNVRDNRLPFFKASNSTNAGCSKNKGMVSELCSLYFSGKCTDCIIFSVEGNPHYAHKIVLYAMSSVLRRWLKKEESQRVYKTTIKSIALKTLINFLYTSVLPESITWVEAAELYPAAEDLGIAALKSGCSDIFKSQLSDENICEILKIACEYQDSGLKDAVQRYVNNDPFTFESEKWRAFADASPKLASAVMLNYLTEHAENADATMHEEDSLLDRLRAMFTEPEFCDCSIIVSGKRYDAHKSIVYARTGILSGDHLKLDHAEVDLSKFDPHAVKLMLDFLYFDKVSGDDWKTGSELYAMAVECKIPSLVESCRDVMLANISSENLPKFLVLARDNNDSDFRESLENLLLKMTPVAVLKEVWKSLFREEQSLAGEVMSKFLQT